MDCILIINAGSSSLKFGLYNAEDNQLLLDGAITGLGQPQATLRVKAGQEESSQQLSSEDTKQLDQIVLSVITKQVPTAKIVTIGHRVVHGGPQYNEPTRLNAAVIAGLRRIESLAPNHMPMQLDLAAQFMTAVPLAAQYACFDTSFHHTLPAKAQRLAIPRKYTSQGVRKFGFHGLSLQSVVDQLKLEYPALPEKIVVAHLGSGVSISALQNGVSVDTTMSLTPNSGVPMSTRSGDVDPGVLTYIAATDKLDVAQITKLLATESGLLSLSGTTADMETLLKQQAHNPQAAEAIEVFCYNVSKAIAAMSVALGGMQVLVFAGGMGEVAAEIRVRICASLYHMGIILDEKRNLAHQPVISAADAKVDVRIVHTDEAAVMVRHVQDAGRLEILQPPQTESTANSSSEGHEL